MGPGAFREELRKVVMVNTTLDTARKWSDHTATALTHTGVMTQVHHSSVLHDDEESNKRKYNELQRVHGSDSRRPRVLIDDEIRIVR